MCDCITKLAEHWAFGKSLAGHLCQTHDLLHSAVTQSKPVDCVTDAKPGARSSTGAQYVAY